MKLNASRSSAAVEDYLERILELINTKGYARVVDIATSLGISQASVTNMVQRLDGEGLLKYEKYRGLVLTTAGETLARNIAPVKDSRRHQARPDPLLLGGWRLGHEPDDRSPRAAAALPQRRPRLNFFQKRIPDGAPDWLHTTIIADFNGTPSQALKWPTWPTWCGPSTSAASASTPGRSALPIPSTATNCASTRPRAWHQLPDGARSRSETEPCSTTSASPATSRPPATAACTSTCVCCRRTTASRFAVLRSGRLPAS